MNDKLAIFIQGLIKDYGRVRALAGIDLEVGRGEIFGFLGPNGAGKTTAIRCMLDLIRPNGGTLRVFDIDPQADPVAVRKLSGYLPGELYLEETMTVEAALDLYASLRPGGVDPHFLNQLVDRLEMDRKLPIRSLSKGNKQKVGVVQALMHRPPLLLLDEPTGGLDPLMQQEVLRLVREAQEAGATVFFSSHNLSEVQAVAERVAIIRAGRIVEVATTADLTERAFRRASIRFREAVDLSKLAAVPGVSILSKDGDLSAVLQIEGEMDALIKCLSTYPVSDFETHTPTLEEVFLSYYAGPDAPEG